ncbi:F0F1-type ATP synthase assembly protein I [Thermosipho japonicus]|uniref:F0F1-type ATP synthase assembly protein I n=1 Tax=Thermosipho japonicus TaxID=90323 RepID=A0A841GU89_9BACT|nr:multidrug transporter [Thermosipho japonicus]MBB6063070.1 F0F1-type ATP synthase assembly protein I [Thermosipho japonicus]
MKRGEIVGATTLLGLGIGFFTDSPLKFIGSLLIGTGVGLLIDYITSVFSERKKQSSS